MDAVSGVDGSSTGVGWIDRAVGIEWMIMHELLMYGQTQAGWEPQPLGDEVACTSNDNTPILCRQRRYTILLTEWGIRHRHNGWYIQRLRGRDYIDIYGKGYRAGAMWCDGSIETE